MACLAGDEYPYTTLFCEGRWGGMFRGATEVSGRNLPEWGNCISALFICMVGLLQLITWDHDCTTLRIASSLFVVNGWSSFLNHVTGLVWWSFVDGMSMVVVVFLVLALVVEEFSEERFCNTDGRPNPRVRATKLTRVLRASLWVFATSSMWIVMVDRLEGCEKGGFQSFPGMFELGFGIPIVIVLVLLIIQFKTLRPCIYATSDDLHKAWTYMLSGIVIAVAGTVLWIVTENTCDTVVFFRWFPGHICWHVLMTYGLGNVMLFIVFVRANNQASTASFHIPEHPAARAWAVVFPMVNWTSLVDPKYNYSGNQVAPGPEPQVRHSPDTAQEPEHDDAEKLESMAES